MLYEVITETGIVIFGPEMVSRGFVFETETGHLLEDAKCVILEIVEEIGPEVPDRARKIRRITSYNVCYTKLLRDRRVKKNI